MKNLTKRQLAVIDDLFSSAGDEAAVLAGIHYDELDQAGIDLIRSLADEAGRQAIAWVRSGGNRR